MQAAVYSMGCTLTDIKVICQVLRGGECSTRPSSGSRSRNNSDRRYLHAHPAWGRGGESRSRQQRSVVTFREVGCAWFWFVFPAALNPPGLGRVTQAPIWMAGEETVREMLPQLVEALSSDDGPSFAAVQPLDWRVARTQLLVYDGPGGLCGGALCYVSGVLSRLCRLAVL